MHKILIFPLLLLGETGLLNQPPEGRIRVYVWGEVKGPGVYSFTASPDITELISTAGGPTQRADLSRIKMIDGMTGKERRINLGKSMRKGELIFLKSGDIVIIPQSRFSQVRDFLIFLTSITTLVNLYFTIQNYRSR